MKVAFLDAASPTITNALLSHGWEGVRAREAAAGVETLALHATGVPPEALPALVQVAGRLGLEILTGEEWVVLLGARSRLAVFARPWSLPAELAEFAIAAARTLPADPPQTWRAGRIALPLDAPVWIGILNVTPDSFSDGGEALTLADADRKAASLVDAGATLLDIGGQSTRPGAVAIEAAEECARILAVMRAVRRRWPELPLSVDTVSAEVAVAALGEGADVINDVSGGRLDAGMARAGVEAGAGVIVMHSRGAIETMARYDRARYTHLVAEVVCEVRDAVTRFLDAGVPADRIAVDPGFGFAKTPDQSLLLLRDLGALRGLGHPICVGVSRKRFLGSVTGRDAGDRDRATAAACALAWERGARLFRVHNVAAVRDAVEVVRAMNNEQ